MTIIDDVLLVDPLLPNTKLEQEALSTTVSSLRPPVLSFQPNLTCLCIYTSHRMLPLSSRYISHRYKFYHRFSLIAMAGYGMPSSSRSNASVVSSLISRYNNPELVEALAGLAIDTEQRDAIAVFVQATRQSVDVAIEALQDCGWDLLEAISQFGDDDERDDTLRDSIPRNNTEQDEEYDDIEPIRPQTRWRYQEPSPEPRRRSRESTPSNMFLLKALEQATAKSGKDHPRSYRSVVVDPIAIDYAPLGL